MFLIDRSRLEGGRRLLRRFSHERDASVAIEFGFISLPFLALVLAIFQTSMVHVTSMTLQSAVTDAPGSSAPARPRRWASPPSPTRSARTSTATFDCKALIKVDVKSFTSFSAATAPVVPVKDGVIDTSTFGTSYDTGGAGKIVVVQAAIAYPIVVPLLGNSMVNLNGRKLLIMASAAFKNEAF